MPEFPDEPDDEEDVGSQISQEALDALLSATSDAPDIDDGDALGVDYLDADSEESDRNFGLPAAGAAVGAAEPAVAENDFALGGGFDFAGGQPDIPALEISPARAAYPSDSSDAGFLRVRDIPLDIVVELGRTRLLIKDVLDLSAGAIIELDKIAGEPVDLFANGLLVARGEVIVIDDNFGVRLTEIITAEERLKSQHSHSIAA
jgi:flagellar motor switch protein FliN/FliY